MLYKLLMKSIMYVYQFIFSQYPVYIQSDNFPQPFLSVISSYSLLLEWEAF